MKEKFLLYIDILGFSDLVQKNPEKVREIYNIVNKLNVHKHDAFQTIIFSDTILVYNKVEAESIQDKKYITMYMIEFVQDLIFKGLSIDLNFRAVLTFGEFEHYNLENAECYYGKSLISAYLKEKEINGIGLFMDSDLEVYNDIYKFCTYNSEMNFIFLFQTLLRIKTYGLEFPIPNELIEPTYEFCWLEDEITLLRKYYKNSNSHESPKVRAKYLQTYLYYRNLLPSIFQQLEMNDFSMKTVNSEVDWSLQDDCKIKE
jgi:hypothetical protein